MTLAHATPPRYPHDMNAARFLTIALVLLLSLPLPLGAQTASPQLYQVELILFRQLDAVAADAWSSSNRTSVPRNARALPPRHGEDPPPPDYFRVEGSQLRLNRAWQRMQGLIDVEPLLLMGWRQSHGLLRVGRRVRLDEEIDGLTGFLALRLGNRLVAEIDLTLDAPTEPGLRAIRRNPDPTPAANWRVEPMLDDDAQPPPTPEGFRLHQRRTLRLGEDHYFDHPAFGVILRVNRVERDGG